MRAAASGNRDAYRSLVRSHQNLVSSLALAVVHEGPASQDVTQEVFIHLWRKLKTLRNPESFLPWLRQLTRNRAVQHLRERGRRRESPHASEPSLLAQVVDALPDESREVVCLYYREGQSVAQVAKLLELREEAVRKRLSRARELLRASVLEETGKVLVRTAPGEAFCAGVMSALPTGGPLVAGAATFKLSLMSKVSLAWLGPVGGFASAVGGVLWRHRREMRRSRDERERHDLRRLREPNAGGDGGNEGGRPPDASVARSRCPDGRRLRLDHGGALRSLVSPNRRPKEGLGGGGAALAGLRMIMARICPGGVTK